MKHINNKPCNDWRGGYQTEVSDTDTFYQITVYKKGTHYRPFGTACFDDFHDFYVYVNRWRALENEYVIYKYIVKGGARHQIKLKHGRYKLCKRWWILGTMAGGIALRRCVIYHDGVLVETITFHTRFYTWDRLPKKVYNELIKIKDQTLIDTLRKYSEYK